MPKCKRWLNSFNISSFVPSNNTTSDASGESDVAMQSIEDVEGDVGNSSETAIHRTNINETHAPEGGPSMERNESSSGPGELGSTGSKIPLK